MPKTTDSAEALAPGIETKFLRLRAPVALRHPMPGGWRVCWLGGWDKCGVFFVVMVMRSKPVLAAPKKRARPTCR